MSGELVDKFGRRAGICEKIAAGDVDLAFQGQSDRIARPRAFERAFKGDDLFDPSTTAGARDQHFFAGSDPARGDGPAITPELAIGSVDPLHRKAEGSLAASVGNLDRMKVFEQGWSAIPRRPSRPRGDVVARFRGQRDRPDRGPAETRGKGRKPSGDLLEAAFLETDEIHFVDG